MNTDKHGLISEKIIGCAFILKATKLPLGLLINFGTPKVQIKRMLNDR